MTARSGGQPEGKLTGVPVNVKDLVYVTGVRTFGGAPGKRIWCEVDGVASIVI